MEKLVYTPEELKEAFINISLGTIDILLQHMDEYESDVIFRSELKEVIKGIKDRMG